MNRNSISSAFASQLQTGAHVVLRVQDRKNHSKFLAMSRIRYYVYTSNPSKGKTIIRTDSSNGSPEWPCTIIATIKIPLSGTIFLVNRQYTFHYQHTYE